MNSPPPEPPTAVVQRGALQVTVTPGTPTTTAGTNFSIAVNITNPFEVPIEIQSVTTLTPHDFYDVNLVALDEARRDAEEELRQTRHELLRQLGTDASPKVLVKEGAGRRFLRALLIDLPFFPGALVSEVTSSAVARVAQTTATGMKPQGALGTAAELFEEPSLESVDGMTPGEIRGYVDDLLQPVEADLEKRFETTAAPTIPLQPGDSVSTVFTLRTRRTFLFRPTAYNLTIDIAFELDGRKHRHAVPVDLTIQAALHTVVVGAAIGSAFGVVAQNPDVFAWSLPAVLPQLISALILSCFAVIGFARKEGVQPVIAIQDFWGGLFVGFLVGFSGIEVLGGVIPEVGA